MKIIGIVAEYNPFHEGHAYQIQKAKEQCGAEFAVVVMNGDFGGAVRLVQNGGDIQLAVAVITTPGGGDGLFDHGENSFLR